MPKSLESLFDPPELTPTAPIWSRGLAQAKHLMPGVFLAGVIALAAMFISDGYGGPVMLYALLIGIAFHSLSTDAKFASGINFAAKTILKIGVALLGVRITLGEIDSLGAQTLFLVLVGVGFTIGIGTLVGRALGLRTDHAILSAGAVAICGASAALAISAVLPRHEKSECNTIMTVIGVTALSTIAMVLYPLIVTFTGFSATEAGIFIGATIHDVAQVVGAGYTISEDAGDVATIVKLMRVTCLVPVIFILSLIYRGQTSSAPNTERPLLIPFFLIGFIVLMAINSAGMIPTPTADALSDLSRFCLIIAVGALGVKTSLTEIIQLGPKPLATLSLQTLMLALLILGALFWIIGL